MPMPSDSGGPKVRQSPESPDARTVLPGWMTCGHATQSRLSLEVSRAVCPDRVDAAYLEGQVVGLLRPHGVWNR